MINGNFSTTLLPLDIEEWQLGLGKEQLEAEMTQLDADGWHAKDQAGKTSWLRFSVINCKFREEVLALLLGSATHPDLQERA